MPTNAIAPVREHNFRDKVEPGDRLVTAYYIDSEMKSAEEMDFLVRPLTSDAKVREFCLAWAAENLDPNYWDRLELGQPSCGTVSY